MNKRWGEPVMHRSYLGVSSKDNNSFHKRLTLDAHETGEQQAISGGGETDAEVAHSQLMERGTRIHEALTDVIGGLRCREGKTRG
jgi:hypothetical protein